MSAKDVLGRSLPKSKRGQLTGWAGSASGAIAIGSAALLFVGGSGEDSTVKYAIFLAAAALLWWMAAAVNARIFEPASHEDSQESLTGGFRQQIGLLRDDVAFRDFLVVRALAVGSGLSTPFIVSLAYGRLGGGASWLGIFIIVEGLAAMLSGPLWGRWADRSSRSVLRGAMGVVAALLLAVIAYVQFGGDLGFDGLVFPLILFFLGIAHAGVRIGRKTYVVDMAEGNKRTDYVAVGNTLIGVLLVLAGLLTGMASMLAVEWALGILALSAAIGAIYGSRLPGTK